MNATLQAVKEILKEEGITILNERHTEASYLRLEGPTRNYHLYMFENNISIYRETQGATIEEEDYNPYDPYSPTKYDLSDPEVFNKIAELCHTEK